ncbi:MAG: D-aminoacyl-tRNA deacylase [Vicinamibacteria bacterium]|jgi:D-tyrosyl-tRNA(Tyr) deacylase|nr:D-aminoacyl-tRNA deacylase [Vicinamibacteria bacterium]
MRAVVQRVSRSAVHIEGREIASIGNGLVVLLGVGSIDNEQDAALLAEKIAHLRIFPDDVGQMNRSLRDVGGAALVVSQFTLYGDCRRGRRPSYSEAAPPEQAERLYNVFIDKLRAYGLDVRTGVFRAMMDVSLINDGPVTLLLDTKKVF